MPKQFTFCSFPVRQSIYGYYINDKCTSTKYNSSIFQRHWQCYIDQKIQQNRIAHKITVCLCVRSYVVVNLWRSNEMETERKKRNNKKINNKDKIFNLINHIIFNFHHTVYIIVLYFYAEWKDFHFFFGLLSSSLFKYDAFLFYFISFFVLLLLFCMLSISVGFS